jgi:hypothetical protein
LSPGNLRQLIDQISAAERQVAEPERQVAEPERQVAEPERQVAEPERQVAEPERQVAEPAWQVAEPAWQVAEPAWQVAEPERQVAEPERQVAEPERQVAEPAWQVAEAAWQVARWESRLHGGSYPVYRNEREGSAKVRKGFIMNSRSLSLIVKSFGLILCAASLASSQTERKTVEWTPRPLGSHHELGGPGIQIYPQIENIQIDDVVVAGASITLGQSFVANEDWLQTLIIRVRNVSSQRLASIQVTLILPEMDLASPDVVYCYGCAQFERERGVGPGEMVELKMPSGGFYDWVKSRASEKGGIALITKAQIRDMFVTLPDGTHWLSGCIKTANAKNACRMSTAP